MAHPHALLGGEEIPGGGREEAPRRLRVGALHAADVDDRVDAGQRASSSPAPIDTSTPRARDTTSASCPARRTASTVCRPATPVPPITAIRIAHLLEDS